MDENQTNQGGPGMANTPTGNLEGGKTSVRRVAEDLKSAAGEMAGEYRGKAEQAWGDATDRVRTFQEDGEQYVRDNPTKAVFTALGIGFVLGIVFRR